MATSGGRGIESMLNLPHLDDIINHNGGDDTEIDAAIEETVNLMDTASTNIAKLGGDDHAQAMDVLHDETLKHSRDLMDLAYNVDDRSRRGILEIASSMYKNAIDAKNSKRDMQLKAIKLAMDQQKLDIEERKNRGVTGSDIVDSQSIMVEDRNELLRKFREQAKNDQDNND